MKGDYDDDWGIVSHFRWAQNHSEQLAQRNSKLEFSLHRLKFLDLLQQKKAVEALQYARKFQQFAQKHSAGWLSVSLLLAIFGLLLSSTPKRHVSIVHAQ